METNALICLCFVASFILLTKFSNGLANDKCILPPYPPHGSYVVVGKENVCPGQAFDTVLLNLTCHEGYTPIKNSTLFCISGIWSDGIPECVRSCRLDKHPSVKYRCLKAGSFSEDRVRDCDVSEPLGTIVKPECNAPVYTGVLSYMRCTNNGWNYIAVCQPECGRTSSEGMELVLGGRPVKRGEFPWHVGIYLKTTTPYQQICGGSLVTTTVILSAAHCFWDRLEERKQPASRFAVAVGKLYRPWNEPHDVDAQKSDVREIKVPTRFQGVRANFQQDIAIVTVVTPVVYQTNVRPVCVDFDKIFETRQLQPGNIGRVAGWGLTAANGQASPVLKVLDVPYVDIVKCLDEAPVTFKQYITGDKICAGSKDGQALCKGDSGGGLVFSDNDRGSDRYYLRGIVSTAPASDDACNAFAVSSFTQIRAHASFIVEKFICVGARYNLEHPWVYGSSATSFPPPPTGGAQWVYANADLIHSGLSIIQNNEDRLCVLPPYPQNGDYVVDGEPNASPGQAFNTIRLNVTCNGSKENTPLFCSDGKWSDNTPTCTRPTHGKVVVCYVASWAVYRPAPGSFTLEDLEPSLCTHLVYAFAGLDEDTNSIKSRDPWQDLEENFGKAGYKRLVAVKQRYPHLNVTISIGGWSEGSVKFSKMSRDPESRKKFIKSVLLFLKTHKFDGLDLDWEWPAKRGGKPEDKASLVSLVKELKEAFEPHNYILTAAVAAGKDTIESSFDIAELSRYLDFIHMMCYDYHGSWDGVIGPNAPLRGNSDNDFLSVEYTIKYMLSHGVSPYKMVLGVPMYGRTYILADAKETFEFGAHAKSQGFSGPLSGEPGFMGYNEICMELSNKTSDWTQHWHEQSSTPYLRDGERVLTYDNARSIAIKVKTAMDYGLGGLMVRTVDTDDFKGMCQNDEQPYVDFVERYDQIVKNPVLGVALKTLDLPDANRLTKRSAYTVSNGKLRLHLPERAAANYNLMRTINEAMTLALEERMILDAMRSVEDSIVHFRPKML